MKIAIATEGEQVSEHFGRCENFTIVEIENTEVINKTVVNASGNQHEKLPIFILTQGAFIVIAGEMGDSAKKNLKSNGIQFIAGAEGSLDEIVQSYISGTLISNEAGCSSHEHHHENEGGGCQCGHN